MKNILATVDLEEKSNAIVEAAAELAEKFGASVWVVHIAAPEPDFVGYDIGPQYIRDTLADELRQEHRMLQDLAGQLEKRGIPAEGLLIQGATADMILAECEKLNIDLIVMGHRQHGLLHQIFFGNTDLDVVRRSKIPVLLIPLD